MSQSKLHRLFSTLSISIYVFLPLFLLFLIDVIVFPFPLAIVYIPWLIFDRHTPRRGGRSSAWFRGLSLWRYMRD